MSKGIQSILKDCAIDRAMVGVAAGQATNSGEDVDMANFEGVLFILAMGTLTGPGIITMHAEQSAVGGGAGYADIEGTAVAAVTSDDDKLLLLEVKKQGDRYIRPVVITSGGNGVIDGVIAVKYGSRVQPVTQPADVANSELHVSPVEGTI